MWITTLHRHGVIHQARSEGEGWVIQLTAQAGAMSLPTASSVLELVAHLQHLRHPRRCGPHAPS
ncbi:hypothetical protein EBN88_00400 [Streptomyces triticirhizae]|uniref:Uncharacterized protein n=1 Tax=Streptomyces triticirhizae TaxID=2483353 RepID=A0A3M2MB36_9ACTN|nr:hypothetical protein EBN88_00400 [Streptomyces triticirhizae]